MWVVAAVDPVVTQLLESQVQGVKDMRQPTGDTWVAKTDYLDLDEPIYILSVRFEEDESKRREPIAICQMIDHEKSGISYEEWCANLALLSRARELYDELQKVVRFMQKEYETPRNFASGVQLDALHLLSQIDRGVHHD